MHKIVTRPCNVSNFQMKALGLMHCSRQMLVSRGTSIPEKDIEHSDLCRIVTRNTADKYSEI